MYLTWLDSNSWTIELAGQKILLDPWLVGPLVFNNLAWLFQADRLSPRAIPDQIDLILLSQGLEDHAHPPTLAKLDRHLPVVGSPNATQVVQKLAYEKVTTLHHHESVTIGDRLLITAVPGSPIGPNLIENGYVLKDLQTGHSIYYEPHGFHSPTLQKLAPIDVVITPIIDLSLPLLGPVIKGTKSALQLVEMIKPQYLLPTAAGGDIQAKGLLMSLLKSSGSPSEFQQMLKDGNLSTKVIEAIPGDRLEISF